MAPKLTSDETPLNPYRVIADLARTVDLDNTIITHDAGSPRDQISPFWVSTTPLSYIGWGKTTQLGYGLGLAMGAKLVQPDKLCINLWGDAAIGFTGMDFETAVRERIPILSILLNNFCMAIELKVMPVSTERYRSTDISGDYAAMARAFGGYGERVTEPAEIVPAIRRGIAATERGEPALLEFITSQGGRGLEVQVGREPAQDLGEDRERQSRRPVRRSAPPGLRLRFRAGADSRQSPHSGTLGAAADAEPSARWRPRQAVPGSTARDGGARTRIEVETMSRPDRQSRYHINVFWSDERSVLDR